MCVLHLHEKRCSLGRHESLVMIVTSFTLRSPCSWKLECEMYVLQFYLNLFSAGLAQPSVSYATLVLETWRFTFGGSLVGNAGFGDLVLHLWRKSRTKRRRSTSVYRDAPTHRRSYIPPAHPHRHSFTSALSFFLCTPFFSE